MSKSDSVSICMIACNEESCIDKTLAEVSCFFNEIIFVDTGSTDNTVAIARQYTPHIFFFKWNNSFSDARNYSLQKASNPWIFILDADELIDEKSVKTIHEDIKKNAAFSIITRNYSFSSDFPHFTFNPGTSPYEAGTGFFPSSKIRLFQNSSKIRFSGCIHESVEQSLNKETVLKSDAIIHHYGYLKSKTEISKKNELYLSLVTKKCADEPDNFMAWFEAAMQQRVCGYLPQAFESLNHCISLKPDYAKAWYNLGTLSQNSAEALNYYHQALTLSPGYHEALYNIAKIQEQQGNIAAALECVTACINIQKRPEYFNTAFILAIRLNMPEKAGKYISEGIACFPDNLNLKRNYDIFISNSR